MDNGSLPRPLRHVNLEFHLDLVILALPKISMAIRGILSWKDTQVLPSEDLYFKVIITLYFAHAVGTSYIQQKQKT